MKAFILDRYGSADRVRAGDMPDPELLSFSMIESAGWSDAIVGSNL